MNVWPEIPLFRLFQKENERNDENITITPTDKTGIVFCFFLFLFRTIEF